MSEPVTFRDFAAKLMGGDADGASYVLQTLLDVDSATALTATEYFRDQLAASPDFMMKAMGMRDVVNRRDETALGALLVECFGIDAAAAAHAAKRVLGPPPGGP